MYLNTKKKRKKKVIKSREVEEKNHYKPSPVPPSCGCSIWEFSWKGSRSGWASAPGWLWGSLWAASPRAGAGKALPCCGTALPGHPGHPRVQPNPIHHPGGRWGTEFAPAVVPWDRGLWRAGCLEGKAGITHLPAFLLLVASTASLIPSQGARGVLSLIWLQRAQCNARIPGPLYSLARRDWQPLPAPTPGWSVLVGGSGDLQGGHRLLPPFRPWLRLFLRWTGCRDRRVWSQCSGQA